MLHIHLVVHYAAIRENQLLICNNTDESQKHYVEWKKREAKSIHSMIPFIFFKNNAKQICGDQNNTEVALIQDVLYQIGGLWKMRLSNQTKLTNLSDRLFQIFKKQDCKVNFFPRLFKSALHPPWGSNSGPWVQESPIPESDRHPRILSFFGFKNQRKINSKLRNKYIK